MIKIDFEFETEHGVFRDALHLPDNHSFTEEEIENVKIDWDDLLTPTRPEDQGNNLWSVFNVIQEKLVHGMFNYTYGTKNRKARKIKNFKQDMVLNEKLYDLALEYAN